MNVNGVKTCLSHIIGNMPMYKEGISHKVLEHQLATVGNGSNDSWQEENDFNALQDSYDKAVRKQYLSVYKTVEDNVEALFREFAEFDFEASKTKISSTKLWAALEKLPSEEAKHLLVLAIKYHGLGLQSMRDAYRELSILIDNPYLENEPRKTTKPKIHPRFSLSYTIKEKEKTTLEEIYNLSKQLDIDTLKSIKE